MKMNKPKRLIDWLNADVKHEHICGVSLSLGDQPQFRLKQRIKQMKDEITEHECSGSKRCSLGIRTMPEGYTLMLNADRTHYYWLRNDGAESCVNCDKWAVYQWAKHDSLEHGASE